MDIMALGQKDTGVGTHMEPQQKWGQRSSRGHLRSLAPNGQDMTNWSLYPHTLMDFHGTCTKGYWGISTHVNPLERSFWGHLRSLIPNG